MGTSPNVAVKSIYTVHVDDIPAMVEITRKLARAGRASSGCVYFNVARDVEDSSKFHLIEGWDDQTALEAFSQSEEFKTLLQEAMKLRIQDRSGLQLSVSDAEPLTMPG